MAAAGRRGGGCRRLSLSLSSVSDSSRPLVDRRSRLEDTPSRGKLYKEPLCFQSGDTLVSFENVFLSGKSKIRFLVFTVLPLKLFWS
jgi:hypothetical protein